jgi:hypothetical protein
MRAVAGIKADWRGEGPQGRVGRQNGEEAGKKDIAFGGLGSRWGLLTGGRAGHEGSQTAGTDKDFLEKGMNFLKRFQLKSKC